MVSIDQAIKVLNEAVNADREAMQQLITNRVSCNEVLADHPTIQVGAVFIQTRACGKTECVKPERYEVGILGIINGLFGVDSDGWGFIAARYDDSGELIDFIRTPARSIEQGLNNALQELGLKGG